MPARLHADAKAQQLVSTDLEDADVAMFSASKCP